MLHMVKKKKTSEVDLWFKLIYSRVFAFCVARH